MIEKLILSRCDALKLTIELLSKSPYEVVVTENGRDSFIKVVKAKNISCTICFGGFKCDEVCGQMVIHPAFGRQSQTFSGEIKSLLPVIEITETVAEFNAAKIAKEKRIKALEESEGETNSEYCFGAADEDAF